ncbi:MAG: tRNA glutamyl-Q(34) synthetase GluQRS [Trueperaceae bacterium]|nr:tRNA glutamyl-Q(34) synthetase GluQRS [Trueperaceae bacterium]
MRGRYAPSPTGYLHLGNVRTALVAYLQARQAGSSFVLRIEDLDSARSRPDYIRANMTELQYLGIDWDEGPDVKGPYKPYIQSERHDFYEEALKTLVESGQVFECFLSRKELRDLASAPHGQMPIYGQAERALNEKLKAQKKLEGKTPSLRFRVEQVLVSFNDGFMGEQSFEVSDFIVRRADGEWAYQLAVVVDDALMKIEEVVRGEDLLESTAAQLILYKALGYKAPTFFHVPLLIDETGERMSKRKGSLTVTALREVGVKAERILGFLAYSLDLHDKLEPLSMAELKELYQADKLKKEAFKLEKHHLEFLGVP